MCSKRSFALIIGSVLLTMGVLAVEGGCKRSSDKMSLAPKVIKSLVGESEEYVINKLGNPESVELTTEGGRMLLYTKTGVKYTEEYDIKLIVHIDSTGKCFRAELDD